MTVTLSPRAEQLVQNHLARGFAQSSEEVIERALESIRLDRDPELPSFGRSVKTPAEAVEDLINEGRKY